MVFSYYLYELPYTLFWSIKKFFHKLNDVVFYCQDPLDHYVFLQVNKYLEHVQYVTDSHHVMTFLEQQSIPYLTMPVYPKVVIMARHATHKFPCRNILKIGMRHGAYHFKRMTSAENYNQFDLYLMTSLADVKAGKEIGVRSANAIGFPKLDPAFDGTIDHQYLQDLKEKLNLDQNKETVLFSATYDASGMSAIDEWYEKISQLTEQWNILVTLHSWVKKHYINQIRLTPDVHLIEEENILPYIILSDVVVGDTSSILAECSALDKPIITFKTSKAKRSLDEMEKIIASISYRIDSFDQLPKALEHAITNKSELAANRAKANLIFFDRLDGKAGERAAQAIKLQIGKKQ